MRKREKKNKTPLVHNSSSTENHSQQQQQQQEVDVSYLVLWKSPLLTSYYAALESLSYLGNLWSYLLSQVTLKRIVTVAVFSATLLFLHQTPGSHQTVFLLLQKNILWSLYWLGLGFLSSFGLGFGLHTFVLYLAPHLVAVTLGAYACQSVDFLEPPYPDRIECSDKIGEVTLWVILYKVIWECFMWGAGTAVGELPPYFAAQRYRMLGSEESELEELSRRRSSAQISFADRCKVAVHDLVDKAGFFGILACASVPNPFFDLAGMICGYSLVPFRTFFGATLIGKAVIKMLVQTLFVIFIFSEEQIQLVIQLIKNIPRVGPAAGPAIEKFLEHQKNKLRHHDEEEGYLRTVINLVVYTVVVCFLISAINKLAQEHKKQQLTQSKSPETRK